MSKNHDGWKRGIRVGSARDGSVTAFIPEPVGKTTGTSAAEGVAADAPERAATDDLLRDLDAHLQARQFALDYDSLLDEEVQRMLLNRTENAPDAGQAPAAPDSAPSPVAPPSSQG